jgi:hypothetical protein
LGANQHDDPADDDRDGLDDGRRLLAGGRNMMAADSPQETQARKRGGPPGARCLRDTTSDFATAPSPVLAGSTDVVAGRATADACEPSVVPPGHLEIDGSGGVEPGIEEEVRLAGRPGELHVPKVVGRASSQEVGGGAARWDV